MTRATALGVTFVCGGGKVSKIAAAAEMADRAFTVCTMAASAALLDAAALEVELSCYASACAVNCSDSSVTVRAHIFIYALSINVLFRPVKLLGKVFLASLCHLSHLQG